MSWYRGSLLVGLCVLLTACATSSIQKEGAIYRIAVPASNWVIEFPSADVKLEEADTSRPYYLLTNDRTGLNISFNFERPKMCNSSETCRDYFANRLKAAYPNKKNWRMSQIGEGFVSENMDGPVSGFNLRQQHMNAHYVKDGIWVDVHLSKVNYRESDRELFLNFVRSIRFKPNM